VNPHFLAVVLYVLAACALLGMIPVAVLAARDRALAMSVIAVLTGLAVAALLANAAADLW
jgi:hypothetical protein